jgi:hypothetical protein
MFDDFKDLLSAFNAANVRYLIVGGYAVSLHAQPRATKDLDILISTDSENSRAVYMALTKFGAPVEGLSAMDFTEPDNFFRMGTPPVMVDIIPKISGVEFEGAWSRRVTIAIDEALTVSFISRDDLLAAKIATGRAQDLATSLRFVKVRSMNMKSSMSLRMTSRQPWMRFSEFARKVGRNG